MSNKKKRQHFVPRLILRNFSIDQKTIGMYSFTSDIYVEKAGIKEQCYEDYLYGENGEIEEGFQKLESDVGPVFKRIMREVNPRLNTEEDFFIRTFIHYQNQRTIAAISEIQGMTDQLFKSIAKENIKLTSEELEQIEVRMSKKYMVKHLFASSSMMPILLDLKIKILENETDLDLLISDHPVVLYNMWAEQHPKFKDWDVAYVGLASKGLIMFMPLSPKHLLVMFDDTTYKCVSTSGLKHKDLNKKDILALNKLQSINSDECIYFENKSRIGHSLLELKDIKDKLKPLFSSRFLESEPQMEPDGKMSKIIRISKGAAHLKMKFSFLRIMDNNLFPDYSDPILPIRNPELVEEAKKFKKFLDNQVLLKNKDKKVQREE